MPDFVLSLKKEKKYLRQIKNLNIREGDIVEKFIRSKGPGGQHVNKTSSCVYLKHIPTGIEVKCQEGRSQALNRYIARKLLLEKINAHRLNEFLSKKNEEEKLRRKTRPKPRRIKLKILASKRKHSDKKSLRSKIINLD